MNKFEIFCEILVVLDTWSKTNEDLKYFFFLNRDLTTIKKVAGFPKGG